MLQKRLPQASFNLSMVVYLALNHVRKASAAAVEYERTVS